MNKQQSEFINGAMLKLSEAVERCSENGSSASVKLGHKQLGKHIVVVHIVAEIDEGFKAPLSSHASRLGGEPDYSAKTRHHNNHRASRWHKPIF